MSYIIIRFNNQTADDHNTDGDAEFYLSRLFHSCGGRHDMDCARERAHEISITLGESADESETKSSCSGLFEHTGIADLCEPAAMPRMAECHPIWMRLDRIISYGRSC